MVLQLHILAQAIEDVLRYELGLPLVGASTDQAFDIYSDALVFISRYPTLSKKLDNLRTKYKKHQWLSEVTDARW